VEFDTAAVDAAMGFKGKANGPVFQFSIPRAEPVKDHGMEVPEPMGSAIAINGFGLDVLGGYFQALGLGEALDGRALGLDAKTRASLPLGGDPVVSNYIALRNSNMPTADFTRSRRSRTLTNTPP
jgi:hypothetical protein